MRDNRGQRRAGKKQKRNQRLFDKGFPDIHQESRTYFRRRQRSAANRAFSAFRAAVKRQAVCRSNAQPARKYSRLKGAVCDPDTVLICEMQEGDL